MVMDNEEVEVWQVEQEPGCTRVQLRGVCRGEAQAEKLASLLGPGRFELWTPGGVGLAVLHSTGGGGVLREPMPADDEAEEAVAAA